MPVSFLKAKEKCWLEQKPRSKAICVTSVSVLATNCEHLQNKCAKILDIAEAHQPDIVVMDINIRSLNGIDATRRILARNPKVKVIALSVLSSKTAIIEMLCAGAVGFIPKDDSYEELVKAVFLLWKTNITSAGKSRLLCMIIS